MNYLVISIFFLFFFVGGFLIASIPRKRAYEIEYDKVVEELGLKNKELIRAENTIRHLESDNRELKTMLEGMFTAADSLIATVEGSRESECETLPK